MKHHLFHVVPILFALSSCSHTDKKITDIEPKIRAGIESACKFAPTLETIQQLIALFGGPTLPVVEKVVNAVCSTVEKASAAGFRPPSTRDQSFGTYRGVPVIGRSI